MLNCAILVHKRKVENRDVISAEVVMGITVEVEPLNQKRPAFAWSPNVRSRCLPVDMSSGQYLHGSTAPLSQPSTAQMKFDSRYLLNTNYGTWGMIAVGLNRVVLTTAVTAPTAIYGV